eukprot:GHUV01005584.1.p1 GENE.GHUV01005584.1~~GHUV01005584.1.p1  ORF type:complete len:267 (+),score=41.88 GHUV01005584.1:159-959(+)
MLACGTRASTHTHRTYSTPQTPATRSRLVSVASMASRGAFILFEGVDRCGKSTQTAKLASALQSRGVDVLSWNFPDRKNTVTGHAINEYLAGKNEQDDAAIHLLFSANRWEKRSALLEALQSGRTLVVDRYAYSGVAYSAAKAVPGIDIAWCKAPDVGLPAPDLVIYLSISNEVAAARAGFGGERYEKTEFQDKVRGVFQQLQDPSWLVIDAAQPPEEIHEQVLSEVLDVIKCCQEGEPIRQLWDHKPYHGLQPAAAAPAAAKPQS